ncbi:MAG TPA: DUF262 domain-containing protein [Solidesulfovibrio magneticus]|nr:DUF262 domain-containing protein [Solidesulfovibrio magneticus]
MLFPGEKLPAKKANFFARKMTDSEISEKYINGEIRIVTEQARYPLDSIQTMKGVKLQLGPEYQRRGRWNNEKKSRLIESFIMNIPVPPVFLYEYELAHFEVMDGKQRLSTIRDFYSDKFKLEGLEYWPELEGRSYSNLPDTVRSGIDRRYISAIILLYETARSDIQRSKDLKQLVFERINTGGVELSHQESRNALYGGPMNDLCMRLSENQKFMSMWGVTIGDKNEEPSENYKDMTNVELVLRFFAMRQRKRFAAVYLRDYLDDYLDSANRFDVKVLDALENLFVSTMDTLYEVFEEKAFWTFRKSSNAKTTLTSRPSLLMYEPLSFVFGKHYTIHEDIVNNRKIVKSALHKVIEKNSEKFKGRLSNTNYIFERIDILESALLSSLGK